MSNIVVIGGGIAGLSAAYYLKKNARNPVQVTLLEAGSYWGGKILTERKDGFVIEGGPDTFVVTKPWGVKLCRELGIADRLKGTNPDTNKTYILKKGCLYELPGGLTMMIPTEFSPMLRTGLLSWPAKARMGLDFFLPPTAKNGDETLGEFVTRRLGRSAYENLIEPLMSGIYAGDGDQLSLQSTFPMLRDLELEHGGLVKGALALRKQRLKNASSKTKSTQPSPTPGGIFLTPLGGLAEIVENLVENLEEWQVDMRLNSMVEKLELRQGGYYVEAGGAGGFAADGVISAAPPYASAKLLEGFAPQLSRELIDIEFVSTATVSLAYIENDLPRLLDGYGYVIPRSEGRQALACTWTSTKFPHRAPAGYALLRVFIGRAGQEGQIPWEHDGLVEIARRELETTLGITAEPVLERVFIWQDAMPQYNLGHVERLERIEKAVESLPGFELAGNGYYGIGIPDCIHSGEEAAGRILEFTSGENK